MLGEEAQVGQVEHMTGTIETWIIDEPSHRGIESIEQMCLVRDDIDTRVGTLLTEFTSTES